MSQKYNILGYGVCGPNEKYLKKTLDCFKSLCDRVIILGNNLDDKSKELIYSYGFQIREDNREWGLNQNIIKEDFVTSLSKENPEWLICLDMDEVLDISREKLEDFMDKTDSMYVYIVNLWEKGWKRAWSFWNVRVWKWNGMTKFVNRPLHCGLAPEWCYYYGSYVPIILYHYGLKDKARRKKKVARYEKYDPDAKFRDRSYYEALKDDSFDKLDKKFIQDSLDKEIHTVKRKKVYQPPEQKFVYLEKDGRTIDVPEKSVDEYIKRGFKII